MNPHTLAVARGEERADLLLTNAKVLDVYNGRWIERPLAVHDGRIVGMGDYRAHRTVDLSGRWIVPGLIDAHVHVESSMLTPERFASLVLPRGTTTVIADPHEIANVCGLDGIDYLLDASERLPLDLFLMLPSCVPATDIETSGARLGPDDLDSRMDHPRVLGLGEMMNYPGVIYGDESVHRKLDLARARRKTIDGHIEPESLQSLNAYAGAGIEANHECVSPEQGIRNLTAGMALMIREGTAARNLDALLPVVNRWNSFRCMFCTDDRHPDHIEEEGHIDHMVRRAIGAGFDPVEAVRLGSLHAATLFGLKDRGAICPGRRADLVVLDDLAGFHIDSVYKDGRKVAQDGAMTVPVPDVPVPGALRKGLVFPPLTQEDLRIELKDVNPVIGLVPGEIITERRQASRKEARDLKTIAVIERHHGSGNIGLGLVDGFDFQDAAIASTIAHDSHNLIVVGDNEGDMLLAAEACRQMGGGLAVAHRGVVTAQLALPVAGLLSDAPFEAVRASLGALRKALAKAGYTRASDPFMTLAFLALPVIPSLRITDRGLFDVDAFCYLDEDPAQNG